MESYLNIVDENETIFSLTSKKKEMDEDYLSKNVQWTRMHSAKYRTLESKLHVIYNKQHSEAIKKGLEQWLIFKNAWLIRLAEFPEEFQTYKDKINHISIL